jgi:PAS domain-containing protein
MLFDLVERCPFGIYIVDSQFRIANVNAGSKDGTFRNVRPLIGRRFDEAIRIIWPESVAEIIARFRHTLETGEPYFSKNYIQPRADVPSVEAYEWSCTELRFPTDSSASSDYFDSTRLRRTEVELHEATAKFSSVFNQSGIFGIMDVHGYLREVNDLAVDACGYTKRRSSASRSGIRPGGVGRRMSRPGSGKRRGMRCWAACSGRSFDTGWRTARSASLTSRCTPFAMRPAQ